MAEIFVNATWARKDSRNNSVIPAEVRAIETSVIANVDAGVLYANITRNSTNMTNNSTYYNVPNSTPIDPKQKLDCTKLC